MTDMDASPPSLDLPLPFITRPRLKNFRSIAECDVELGPLTVLAGYDAAGKSNFLDALRFVQAAPSTFRLGFVRQVLS